jgi:hypothetical protein
MRYRLAAAVALLALLWLPYCATPEPVHAASACTVWSNTRIPPSTIRVLRTSGSQSGRVQTVDFKTYVKIVLAAEWPPTYPADALRAGAVVVKQYAWYSIMNYRGGTKRGSCYDVVDNTNDQIYRPETRTPSGSHVAAVDATWAVSVTKDGGFLRTGYRSGAWVACGVDADGWHMFQHSARDCALKGQTYEQILHTSFDPGVVVWGPPVFPAAVFYSPPAAVQVTMRDSVTVSWAELPSTEATIVSRQVTLQMAKPINWTCRSDRWLPAIPPWQSSEASPQTVSGLISGYCYRLVVKLTDTKATTFAQSGTFGVDALAPMATFTTPPSDATTPIAAGSYTVAWSESPAEGATIVSRKLVTEFGGQPIDGTCTGVRWQSFRTTTAASPVTLTALPAQHCFRFRVELIDSAGHGGTWMSGVLMATGT